VTENLIVGGCASLPAERQPCNVVTQYHYDRAGNRIAIVDARNYTRTFDYRGCINKIIRLLVFPSFLPV
jgi:YD repeat-containing protein